MTEEGIQLSLSPEPKEEMKGSSVPPAPWWLFPQGDRWPREQVPEDDRLVFPDQRRSLREGMVGTSREDRGRILRIWDGRGEKGCWWLASLDGAGGLGSWRGRSARPCPAVQGQPCSCAEVSGQLNEPEAKGDVSVSFRKFPGAPARNAETLRRASVGGLWNRR